MILNIHNILWDTFNESIELYYNNQTFMVSYGEGDYKELVRRIQNTRSPYPMLWLSSGFSFEFGIYKKASSFIADLEFIVLAEGSLTASHTDRYFDKYTPVIYPVVEAFTEVIRKTEGLYCK